MVYQLVLQSGSSSGIEHPLEKAELFIGRDPSNDIVISDPEVSRRHARLVLTGNTYAIEDLGSTNGTFLRGQRLTAPVVLTPGEVITFGENMQVKFEYAVPDPDATVAALRTPIPVASQPSEPEPQELPESLDLTPPPPLVISPSQEPPTPAPQFVPQPSAPPSVPPIAAPSIQPPPQPAPEAYTPIAPPPEVNEPPLTPQPKKRSSWLIAFLVVIGFLLVFCVIPWLIIELTDSYCKFFAGIFNTIQPGVCP